MENYLQMNQSMEYKREEKAIKSLFKPVELKWFVCVYITAFNTGYRIILLDSSINQDLNL